RDRRIATLLGARRRSPAASSATLSGSRRVAADCRVPTHPAQTGARAPRRHRAAPRVSRWPNADARSRPMCRRGSRGFRAPPRYLLETRLAAAEPRQPTRGLALDQGFERLADERRFLADPGVELGVSEQLIVQGKCRPHFPDPLG